jgi:hypothetical protein
MVDCCENLRSKPWNTSTGMRPKANAPDCDNAKKLDRSRIINLKTGQALETVPESLFFRLQPPLSALISLETSSVIPLNTSISVAH